MEAPGVILLLLSVFLVAALVALVAVARAWRADRGAAQARVEELLADRERSLVEARRESVLRSRSTLKGQLAEQLAPLLPGFRYAPSDARFLGDPVDYVVFSGAGDARDGSAAASPLDIVLLEVKQGGSALSPLQRAIARAVEEGCVRFEVLRVGEAGELSTETWRPRPRGGRAR